VDDGKTSLWSELNILYGMDFLKKVAVEHHMFPMVPYHALPELHEMIKHDLPEPNPSMWHAYREVFPVLLHQLRNEDYFLKRELPPSARPYREEFHAVNMAAAAE
jgi:fatty acid desaturase